MTDDKNKKPKWIILGIIAAIILFFGSTFISGQSIIGSTIWSVYQAVSNVNMGGYNLTNLTCITDSEGNTVCNDFGGSSGSELDYFYVNVESCIDDPCMINSTKSPDQEYFIVAREGRKFLLENGP